MSQPALHVDVYQTISPEALAGLNNGKVAVVTGAARGIGKAIAISIAKTGANVALLDLDAERQADTKAECEKVGVKAFAYACDVTNHDVSKQVYAQIQRDLGDVHIVVNNAGGNSRRPAHMETWEQFWRGVEINVKGALIWSLLVLPDFRARRAGSIINIASRAGTVTMPFAAAYSTGKAGLIRFSACLQAELDQDGFGDDIHVYALHPGAVKTSMTIPIADDVAKEYPGMAEKWGNFHKLFRCVPEVCGQTCAFLSTGRGKALHGKYFDCEQDIGTVVAAGREGLEGLYDLKVEFLGGLPNDGGTVSSSALEKA
ncbi:hypothetical protein SEUCBS140593_010353 [Sporothrix eucalyptigena]|uniref:NAD(P)-binding protein n=1 Tax=Sporothrix eucalyptigena TaxID=1812306 RepID=A0ABP0D2R0_9PEZI